VNNSRSDTPALLTGSFVEIHRAARTTARARIGARALTPHRHVPAVPDTTIATNIHQSFDVERNLSAQITLDAKFAIDDFTQPGYFIISEIPHAGIRADAGPGQQVLAGGETNSVDVGQSNFDALLAREIDA